MRPPSRMGAITTSPAASCGRRGLRKRNLSPGAENCLQVFAGKLGQLAFADRAFEAVEKIFCRFSRRKPPAEPQPVDPGGQLTVAPGREKHDRPDRKHPRQAADPGVEPEVQHHGREEDKIQGQQAQRHENERALLEQDIEESEPLDIISDDKNEDERRHLFESARQIAGKQSSYQECDQNHRPQAAMSQRRWPRSSAPASGRRESHNEVRRRRRRTP